VEDVEADKLALSTLAMHLPVRLRLMTTVDVQARCALRYCLSTGAKTPCTPRQHAAGPSVCHNKNQPGPAPPLVTQVPPMIIEPALWVVQPSGVMAKVPLTVLESRGSTEVRQPAMH